MLQTICIGHLGADAECKNSNGKEFVSFRIANTESWTDKDGTKHENTTWVDCILNGNPPITKYLKRGQQVYVSGSLSLRVYSSAKDRCMKAGATINVKQIELLGGRPDDVPSVLFSEDGQTEFSVGKFFYAPRVTDVNQGEDDMTLVSKTGEKYIADKDGWVTKAEVSS